MKEREKMIDNKFGLSIEKQCKLLAINRSSLYYSPKFESDENLEIMRLLGRQCAARRTPHTMNTIVQHPHGHHHGHGLLEDHSPNDMPAARALVVLLATLLVAALVAVTI